MSQEQQSHPYITIIGGGGGTSAIYPELARRTPNAVAIVSMSDSGGSTGVLSEELGILPVGDLRNVMLAASSSEEAQRLREHRFSGNGSLQGHAAGNLLLAACVESYGPSEGIDVAAKILQVLGRVLPVTLEKHTLVMQDGEAVIRGEHHVDTHHTESSQPWVRLEPEPTMNPEVGRVLKRPGIVAIGPGSTYTSLLPPLMVRGVRETLADSEAIKVLIANLATEPYQTDKWRVVDFVRALSRHGVLVDYVVYNTEPPSKGMLQAYEAEGQRPVEHWEGDLAEFPTVRAIGAALLSQEIVGRNPNDPVANRSLMHHDAKAVCDVLWRIAKEHAGRSPAPATSLAFVGLKG